MDDSIFNPTSTIPLTVELQNLGHPSSLLDDSLFTTTPFSLQELYAEMGDPVVPYDDTRQEPTVPDPVLDREFGCSRFNVTCGSDELCDGVGTWPNQVASDGLTCVNNNCAVDVCVTPKKQSILSSTLTSPKYNSVNVLSMPSDGWPQQQKNIVNHITNGPLSHSEGENIFFFFNYVTIDKSNKNV